jgi:hypothetical protein
MVRKGRSIRRVILNVDLILVFVYSTCSLINGNRNRKRLGEAFLEVLKSKEAIFVKKIKKKRSAFPSGFSVQSPKKIIGF